MQVHYTYDSAPELLKIYRKREPHYTHELERDEAERVAQQIAKRGGYARILFGSDVFAEYGEDPRVI